jgi:hypothetical protein
MAGAPDPLTGPLGGLERDLRHTVPESRQSAAGKRRQDFDPDRLGESCIEVLSSDQLTVHQDRTDGQHPVEPQILASTPGRFESSSNTCRLDRFLIDACGRLGPSPVMKGNSHHCSSLKH